MKMFLNILTLILIPLLGYAQLAQGTVPMSVTLPEIAYMDIEPNNSAIQLAVNAPSEAGASPTGSTINNAKFINYSSAVSAGQKRSIYVQIDYGTIPSGVSIKVLSGNSSTGAGTRGTTTGTVTLSTTPQKIINAIGGAYTGNGNNQGHGLNFTLEVNQVSSLSFDTSNTIGVIYTMIDN